MSHGTCLGFDFGEKRIGVAVGESLTGSARALETLHCRQPGQIDWAAIARLIERWQPGALVVGLPCHADGTPGDLAPRAARFARQLEGRFGLPVHQVDEHLSSREAKRRLLADGGKSRGDRGAVDMMAAAIILETWLASRDP